jgi:hypothetical protein
MFSVIVIITVRWDFLLYIVQAKRILQPILSDYNTDIEKEKEWLPFLKHVINDSQSLDNVFFADNGAVGDISVKKFYSRVQDDLPVTGNLDEYLLLFDVDHYFIAAQKRKRPWGVIPRGTRR